jgi:plastocyanin
MRYFLMVILTLGLGLPTAASAQATDTVALQDNVFNPRQVTSSSGATLVWSNNGAAQHTITADDGSFDSGAINAGETFSFTFTGPGTYPYYCQIHGGPGGEGMAGTIVVPS